MWSRGQIVNPPNLIGYGVGWSARLAGQSVGSVDQSVGFVNQLAWSVEWTVEWSVGWIVGWSGQLVGMVGRSIFS